MSSIHVQMLASIESTLNVELSKFRCLPFYLAMLYLRTCSSNKDFIRRGNLTISYNTRKDCYILTNISSDLVFISPNQDVVLKAGESKELYEWINMLDPVPDKNILTKFIDPYSTSFTIGLYGTDSRGHIKQLNTTHIYSRKKELINLINNAVDLFIKDKGTIPLHYVFPYLFFNQGTYLTIIPGKPDSAYALPVFLKYDHYNQSLRMKESQRGCKYSALSKLDLFNLLYDIEDKNFTYNHMKRRRFTNMVIQPVEVSKVYDGYYKRQP